MSQDTIRKLEQEMKLLNFSRRTVESYLYYITDFLKFARKTPKFICGDDIRSYLEGMVDKNAAASTINTAYSALKFYFQKILKRKFFVNIPRAKKDKKLPTVLSKKEIIDMIRGTENLKHKLMIQIMYSSGLRVSELINLKVDDIDFHRKTVIIKKGKGAKDRISIISECVLKNINKYLLEYKPVKYLF